MSTRVALSPAQAPMGALTMTLKRRATGQQGEYLARQLLEQKKFRIEAINWRPHGLAFKQTAGEIDIIAYHPELALLVFVEVKTRQSNAFGAPAEAVDPRKQARLRILAEHFLSTYPLPAQVSIRFDVITVLQTGHNTLSEICHIEDAF